MRISTMVSLVAMGAIYGCALWGGMNGGDWRYWLLVVWVIIYRCAEQERGRDRS